MFFFTTSVSEFVNNRIRYHVKTDIHALSDEQVATSDIDELAKAIIAKHQVVYPTLGKAIWADEPCRQESGNQVWTDVHIPFIGEWQLFQYHGSTSPVFQESIRTVNDEILVSISFDRPEDLPRKTEEIVRRIQEGLDSLIFDLKVEYRQIEAEAKQILEGRHRSITQHSSFIDKLRATGFNLRRRDDGTEKIIIPIKQGQIVFPVRAATPKAPAQPEMSDPDYDAILQVIQDMVKVFERSPSAFKLMKEEHLRTILLVALNGLFKGNATGETFNGAGKTDILIRVNNDNLFIAECLIWGGHDHFRKKLTEQLFNYSTWRDSKLAAIVFNRKKNFSSVVQKMKETVKGLPNCEAELPYAMETGCRYRFHRTDDPKKPFILTCMAFEVP